MKTNRFGKWAVVGLIVAAMAAPLPALAAQGRGPWASTQTAATKQVRPDCPNNGQQLRDGSGRTRKDSLHQNRGAGLRDGSGRAFRNTSGLKDGRGRGFGRGPVQS